jgi:putative transposase
MFSYEDRIRAVKLYIKLGKRLGATISQLGYPTKDLRIIATSLDHSN